MICHVLWRLGHAVSLPHHLLTRFVNAQLSLFTQTDLASVSMRSMKSPLPRRRLPHRQLVRHHPSLKHLRQRYPQNPFLKRWVRPSLSLIPKMPSISLRLLMCLGISNLDPNLILPRSLSRRTTLSRTPRRLRTAICGRYRTELDNWVIWYLEGLIVGIHKICLYVYLLLCYIPLLHAFILASNSLFCTLVCIACWFW